MSGWFRAPSDGWAIARDHIPTPWPRECVTTDLRWHLDRVEQGVAPFPGRRKLAAAWGWTDWATRAVLRDEAAWKPNHPSTTPVASHFPPAANPPRVGRTPETERNPPASLPPPPQSPPTSLHTRVGTDTDNRHQTQTSSLRSEGERASAPDPSPDQGLDVPGWLKDLRRKRFTGAASVPRDCTSATLLGVLADVVPELTGRPPSKSSSAPAVRLWRVMARDEGRWIPPAEASGRLRLLADAARDCPHPRFARDIRGEGWEKDDTSQSPAAVWRVAPKPGSTGATWEERLQIAQAWQVARRSGPGGLEAWTAKHCNPRDGPRAANRRNGGDFFDALDALDLSEPAPAW